MTLPDHRPPFDEEDAAIVARYLASRGLTAFDPFADKDADQDIIFTTSLAVARWMMEQSFGTRTAAGRLFRGYPVIVENASPNAFAIDWDGLNICGVHIGLVVSVFEISHFVFAQTALFPEIGDPSVERSPSLPEGSALAFIMADRIRADPALTSGPVGGEFLPRSPQRKLAAHLLTQLMLRFAWLHEQYHVLNGHCGFMAERRHSVALQEMPNVRKVAIVQAAQEPDDPQWRLTLHCMEFDADRTALWTMVRLAETQAEPIDELAALPKAVRLKLVLFAGFLMTFIFDQAAKRSSGEDQRTHPLAYHRLHNLVRVVASNLLDPEGMTRAAFNNVMNELTRLEHRVPELCSTAELLYDLRDLAMQEALDDVESSIKAARQQFSAFGFHRCPLQAASEVL